MDPIHLMPIVRAKQFTGTNADEIAAWVGGYEINTVSAQGMQLQVAPDETMWITTGYWLFATLTDPPTYAGMISDWELRMRYLMLPEPVTPVPPSPPDEEPVTP